MLVHLGLAKPPEGWQEGRYDNVMRMHGAPTRQQAPAAAYNRLEAPPANPEPAVQAGAGGSPKAGGLGGRLRGMQLPSVPGMFPSEPPYNKEDEIVYGCDYDDERSTEGVPYKHRLQYDLATSYYWSGNFFKDFVFFVANWHPLFGIICSHPLHPWAKSERALSFMVSCALTLLPSAMLVSEMQEKQHYTWVETHLAILGFVTLPVMVIEVFLYLFAMAPVYCRGNCLLRPVAALIVVLKKLCFGVSFLITFVVVAMTLVTMHGLPKVDLLHPFLLSRAQSWAYWFPMWFLMPCCGFCQYWNTEASAADAQKQNAEAP
mmetsp:Transcript_66400/g.187078  ORF Transcript_66400/g.187078 Transcript_66400/m.187078 type:complete len:318 (+) Transcript_66400:71-1024(+)